MCGVGTEPKTDLPLCQFMSCAALNDSAVPSVLNASAVPSVLNASTVPVGSLWHPGAWLYSMAPSVGCPALPGYSGAKRVDSRSVSMYPKRPSETGEDRSEERRGEECVRTGA